MEKYFRNSCFIIMQGLESENPNLSFNPFFFRVLSCWGKDMEWSYRNVKKIGTHQKQFMCASLRLKEVLFLKLNIFHATMTFVNTVFPLHPKAVKLFITWKVPIFWSNTARTFCCRRWPKNSMYLSQYQWKCFVGASPKY